MATEVETMMGWYSGWGWSAWLGMSLLMLAFWGLLAVGVVTEYHDPDDTWFRRHVLPLLDGYSGRELARLVGADRRTIDRIRGGQVPRPQLRGALTALAARRRTEV